MSGAAPWGTLGSGSAENREERKEKRSMTTAWYPVRVEGVLDPHLGRWRWLVKWLLVLPHWIVLFFLWIAFASTTIVAFFSILFTGRYPRAMFDFNVGVLRWSWRVSFYSYSALGTDAYPPFTLAEVPDYPATLDIAYPEQLSRGLVLVKWWLLALPHYVVVAFFAGGVGSGWRFSGLISLFALMAGVVLLVSGRYPQSIFDFVLGMNRWVLRVAAYAFLMTDSYPPFRLDQGGREPNAPEPDQHTLPPAATEATPGGWGLTRIVTVVVGSLVALLSVVVLAGGVLAVVIDQTQRDDDGFVMSPSASLSTGTFALVSETVDVSIDGPDWAVQGLLGSVKIRSSSDRPVFVGIARKEDVDGYLGGVRHAVVTDLGEGHERYVEHGSAAPTSRPGTAGFWVAASAGPGPEELTWEVADGAWRVVVMNVDATAAVAAEVAVGAELDSLIWIGVGLLAGGALFLLLSGMLIYVGVPKGDPRI
jgi:Domain of unknown function (DUF4389)